MKGSHVNSGNVIITFDKSDALVTTRTTQVSLTQAQLALQNQ